MAVPVQSKSRHCFGRAVNVVEDVEFIFYQPFWLWLIVSHQFTFRLTEQCPLRSILYPTTSSRILFTRRSIHSPTNVR